MLISLLAFFSITAVQPSTALLNNRDGSNQALASVGRIQATFTCTGSWIEPPGAAGGSPAYFLTSGHCISLDPWALITGRESSFAVTFNYFVDTRDSTTAVRASRIVWSTMKGTDLALLELNVTNEALRARGLTPQKLRSGAPGSKVYWAGAPTSFVPAGQAFLRRGNCNALGSTDVIEVRWHWYDQIRNDCPDLYPSASGSPLFDAASQAIVGILGTSTLLSIEGGMDFDCYSSRPCAITREGPVAEQDLSYASPVAPLLTCFAGDGRFDVNLDGCTLDRGGTLTVDTQRVSAVKPGGRWNVRVNGVDSYVWKQIGITESCRLAQGYSPGTGALIDAELPTAEGHYLLCVAPSLARVRDAHVVRYKVDATPLQALPAYEVADTGLAYRVTFSEQAPATGGLEFKRGRLDEVQCEDPAGYRILFSIPPVIFRTDFPQRLCIRLQDEAGNLSEPLRFDFGPPVLQPFGIRNAASQLRAREVARGSRFQIDGIELNGEFRASIRDAAGNTHNIELEGSESTWRQALLPSSTATGPATLTIQPGNSQLTLQVTETSPGLYTANYSPFGPGLIYFQKPDRQPQAAFQCGAILCSDLAIPMGDGSTTDLLLVGTGLSGGKPLIRLGGEQLEVIENGANSGFPGVDNIRARIPAGFSLRGYQLLRAGDHVLRVTLE